MYSLKEAWLKIYGQSPIDGWDGKLYACETNAQITLRGGKSQGFVAAYAFTLVVEGRLSITSGGQELTLGPDDLYTYSPGLEVTVIAASEDYRGICLLADEHLSLEMPTTRDLVSIAYAPIVQLHEPKLTLAHDDAQRLAEKMREIVRYIHSDHIYRTKILQMLYAIFLLDMQDAQARAIPRRLVPQRAEEIFVGFIRLLPRHFARHHDIAFYASQLNVSSVYLSRVVRQVTGHTVVSYVNQMLLMEASYLLRTSTLSVQQIADRLHFADAPSLSKFFKRQKGMSPRAFRNDAKES